MGGDVKMFCSTILPHREFQWNSFFYEKRIFQTNSNFRQQNSNFDHQNKTIIPNTRWRQNERIVNDSDNRRVLSQKAKISHISPETCPDKAVAEFYTKWDYRNLG